MMSSKFENLWQLIGNHTFEIHGVTPYKVMCYICKKLMTDPYVAVCGCQFCGTCIKTYLNNEKRKCPGTGQDCEDEYLEIDKTVLPDYNTRRNLGKLIVKCPYRPCNVATELSNIEQHFLTCQVIPKRCPYVTIGCTDKLKMGTSLNDHLQTNALIHSNLSLKENNLLKNEVGKLKEEIERLRNDKEVKRCVLEYKDKVMSDMHTFNQGIRSELDKLLDRVDLMKKEFLNIQGHLKRNEDEINITKYDVYRMNSRMLAKNVKHDFLWMINNFSDLKGWYESDVFVKDGYKLRIGARVGSMHLYLYLNTVKGDKDDGLDWPMPHFVTLTIVNQVSMTEYKCDTYKFDPIDSKVDNSPGATKASLPLTDTEGTSSLTFGKKRLATSYSSLFEEPSCKIGSCTNRRPLFAKSTHQTGFGQTPISSSNLFGSVSNSPFLSSSSSSNILNPTQTFEQILFGSTATFGNTQTSFDDAQRTFSGTATTTSASSLSFASSFPSSNTFRLPQAFSSNGDRSNYNIWCLWMSIDDIKNIPGILMNDSVMVCCYLDRQL